VLPHADARVGGAEVDADGRPLALGRRHGSRSRIGLLGLGFSSLEQLAAAAAGLGRGGRSEARGRYLYSDTRCFAWSTLLV
jgi:hypothetical protein